MAGAFSTQPRARVIKSIQRGTITLTTGQASNTATISSVDTTKSLVLFGGYEVTSDNLQYGVRVTLTNATTVTANRNGSGAIDTTVSYQVVEFY